MVLKYTSAPGVLPCRACAGLDALPLCQQTHQETSTHVAHIVTFFTHAAIPVPLVHTHDTLKHFRTEFYALRTFLQHHSSLWCNSNKWDATNGSRPPVKAEHMLTQPARAMCMQGKHCCCTPRNQAAPGAAAGTGSQNRGPLWDSNQTGPASTKK